jgi:hypothetical protein
VLHQKIPLPFVCRKPPLDHLKRPALKFLADLSLRRGLKFSATEFWLQAPPSISLAPEPEHSSGTLGRDECIRIPLSSDLPNMIQVLR